MSHKQKGNGKQTDKKKRQVMRWEAKATECRQRTVGSKWPQSVNQFSRHNRQIVNVAAAGKSACWWFFLTMATAKCTHNVEKTGKFARCTPACKKLKCSLNASNKKGCCWCNKGDKLRQWGAQLHRTATQTHDSAAVSGRLQGTKRARRVVHHPRGQ